MAEMMEIDSDAYDENANTVSVHFDFSIERWFICNWFLHWSLKRTKMWTWTTWWAREERNDCSFCLTRPRFFHILLGIHRNNRRSNRNNRIKPDAFKSEFGVHNCELHSAFVHFDSLARIHFFQFDKEPAFKWATIGWWEPRWKWKSHTVRCNSIVHKGCNARLSAARSELAHFAVW